MIYFFRTAVRKKWRERGSDVFATHLAYWVHTDLLSGHKVLRLIPWAWRALLLVLCSAAIELKLLDALRYIIMELHYIYVHAN